MACGGLVVEGTVDLSAAFAETERLKLRVAARKGVRSEPICMLVGLLKVFACC